jgi:hypothetical protein
MASPLYLSWLGTEKARRLAVGAAFAGAAAYVGSILVSVLSHDAEDSAAIIWSAFHDLLVLLATVLIGSTGFLWTVVRARRDRLSNETGEHLLMLSSDIWMLARQIASSVWWISEPRQRKDLAYIDAADAADLLGSDKGQGFLVARLLSNMAPAVMGSERPDADPEEVAGNVVAPEGMDAEVVARARARIDGLVAAGESLHARALEVAAYEPPDVRTLVAATAELRKELDELRYDMDFGSQAPSEVALHAGAMMALLMKALTTVIQAAHGTAAATVQVLDATPAGREIADQFREQRGEEAELADATLKQIALTTGTQELMDKSWKELGELRELLGDWREELGLSREHEEGPDGDEPPPEDQARPEDPEPPTPKNRDPRAQREPGHG